MKALIPPPLVMLMCGALIWLIARWFPSFDFALSGSNAIFWFLLTAGLSVLIAGVIMIFRRKTVIHPNRAALEKATALVTTGVFRYTRNPVYLGMAIMLVAWTIHLENWLSSAGIIVFVLFITHYQIRPEEEALEKIFGDRYINYKRKVRRWL